MNSDPLQPDDSAYVPCESVRGNQKIVLELGYCLETCVLLNLTQNQLSWSHRFIFLVRVQNN